VAKPDVRHLHMHVCTVMVKLVCFNVLLKLRNDWSTLPCTIRFLNFFKSTLA